MPALATDLRRKLERTITTARDVAEVGARAALEALTIHEGKPGSHLTTEQRVMRNRLRAHARQLGDRRNTGNGRQPITRLIHECAYEHWHRMLFARLLAENDLLVEPESGVSVTLEEVEELARDQGVDHWELASRFAQRMLPQIFRPDDPVLAVPLPTETRLELESLLESLPSAVFTADDSLGWVYQFWQSKKKDEVNASGEKITGDTLPAVTQLFTEHYMVLFLLHNTLGAWHAGKVLAEQPELAETANSEQELRDAVALSQAGGYSFEYLRFVQDTLNADGASGSGLSTLDSRPSWRPAAGTFDGWPRAASELKVLDPCCGSGHFLAAAFELLVRLRVHEEGLSVQDAICAVLRDNLFGLEIDQRCVQLAAFNLAQAAWSLAGGVIDLPPLNIACCGIGPSATLDEWLKLAEQAEHSLPRHAREPVRNGLENLHRLFSQAPELGSLIDPAELPSDMFAADYETLQPFLEEVFQREAADVEVRERAVAAEGMAKAADLLAGEYTLVITNVPYLGRRKQADSLSQHLERHYREGKADLATAFVLRCLEFCAHGGTSALVTPQNWISLISYQKLRSHLLRNCMFNFAAPLGPAAFQDMNWWGANTLLVVISAEKHPTAVIGGVDVSGPRDPSEKAVQLIGNAINVIRQRDQLKNPDYRITVKQLDPYDLLSSAAKFGKGSVTGDAPHYLRNFWELDGMPPGCRYWLNSPDRTQAWGGRQHLALWRVSGFDPRSEIGFAERGQRVWGQKGVAIAKMNHLHCTRYEGELFDDNLAVLVPNSPKDLPALWCFCISGRFKTTLRLVEPKMAVTAGTFVKMPCDMKYWQATADDELPNGLPEPVSDDPTQWLFHGRPEASTPPLQVAVARLLGYRWPAELDDEMRLSERARKLVRRCDELLKHADPDGIVCLPAVRSEATAAERLRRMLAAAYGDEWSAGKEAALMSAVECDGNSLDEWLRTKFFEQHCKLFHYRPFIWHIWDGRKDGFAALVNYHKLAAPTGTGRKLLETLTYSYLGDWITRQQHGVKQDEPGAEARLAAAKTLQEELKKILEGEPPYDIFVRWKPLHEQPIGWEPDINDGVRLNSRPFLLAKDVGRKGAGILRFKPNIKWKKDRGKEPQRDKDDFPWFWGWDEQTQDFPGGNEFDGNRWNGLHYTNAFKQAARERAGNGVATATERRSQ